MTNSKPIRWLIALSISILSFGAILISNIPSRAVNTGSAPAPHTIDEKHAIESLQQAVQFPTITVTQEQGRPETFQAFHEWLKRRYPKVFSTLIQHETESHSLWLEWKGSQPSLPGTVLLAHQDVVPVEVSLWKVPPFEGRIQDGHLWGRGSVDDKASMIGILEAVRQLLIEDFTPVRTAHLVFGHDEETGGVEGAKQIAKRFVDGQIAVDSVLDEGGLVAKGYVPGVANPLALIGISEKGYLTLELKATAEAGHSSFPHYPTAIGALARAIDRLEIDLFPTRLTLPTELMLRSMAGQTRGIQQLALSNLWLFKPLVMWQLAHNPATSATVRTTTAATVVKGGYKDNVLPKEAFAQINFRILPGETVETVRGRVIETIHDPSISISVVSASEPAPISDTGHPTFQNLVETIQAVFPEAAPTPYLTIGGTDSKHFAKLSSRILRFAPMTLTKGESPIHAPNEKLPISEIPKSAEFYLNYLKRQSQLR